MIAAQRYFITPKTKHKKLLLTKCRCFFDNSVWIYRSNVCGLDQLPLFILLFLGVSLTLFGSGCSQLPSVGQLRCLRLRRTAIILHAFTSVIFIKLLRPSSFPAQPRVRDRSRPPRAETAKRADRRELRIARRKQKKLFLPMAGAAFLRSGTPK